MKHFNMTNIMKTRFHSFSLGSFFGLQALCLGVHIIILKVILDFFPTQERLIIEEKKPK